MRIHAIFLANKNKAKSVKVTLCEVETEGRSKWQALQEPKLSWVGLSWPWHFLLLLETMCPCSPWLISWGSGSEGTWLPLTPLGSSLGVSAADTLESPRTFRGTSESAGGHFGLCGVLRSGQLVTGTKEVRWKSFLLVQWKQAGSLWFRLSRC